MRLCLPAVPDEILRQLTALFPDPHDVHRLAPTYERTDALAVPAHVSLFKTFKKLQVAQLLRCADGVDMYDTAMASETVLLTPLGRFYWELAAAAKF